MSERKIFKMEFITKQKAQRLNGIIKHLGETFKTTGEREIGIGINVAEEKQFNNDKFAFVVMFLSNESVWCKYTRGQLEYIFHELNKRYGIVITCHYYTMEITGHKTDDTREKQVQMNMIKPMEYLVIDEKMKHVEKDS